MASNLVQQRRKTNLCWLHFHVQIWGHRSRCRSTFSLFKKENKIKKEARSIFTSYIFKKDINGCAHTILLQGGIS